MISTTWANNIWFSDEFHKSLASLEFAEAKAVWQSSGRVNKRDIRAKILNAILDTLAPAGNA